MQDQAPVTGTSTSPQDTFGREIRTRSYVGIVIRQFLRHRTAVVGLSVLILIVSIVLIAPFFIDDNSSAMNLEKRLQGTSLEHPLGTDLLGRDVLVRLIYGGRISLIITSGAVAISLAIGATIGMVAGYGGKLVDMILMRVIDVLMTIPGFLVAIALVAALGPGTYNVMIAVAAFSIPAFARVARGSTLTVESQDFVLAARSLGASGPRIVFRHILPNAVQPLIVQSSLRLATAMLAASGLSFLGLGPQPPTPEWGMMLASGRDYINNAPQLVFYPGITIFLVAISFNMVGDGLRDALDPHLRN